MGELAGWIAPAATMIAAMMTAANLGPRVTGWGFVVFSVGSIAWIVVASASGQQNLLWSNAFLCVVNVVGIWRWLGRRARYGDGGRAATDKSRRSDDPTLFPLSTLDGKPVLAGDGAVIGHAVDAMAQCGDGRISYVVVRAGGVGGIGETLHAIGWPEMRIHGDGIETELTQARLDGRVAIDPQNWPSHPTEADAAA